MAKICWDTNLFIYLFEEHPAWSSKVEELRRRMVVRGDQLFTSALTVGEILVRPIAENRTDLQRSYEGFFGSTAIRVLPFDLAASTHYARIRTDRSVSPADAIHLACAAAARVDLFVTNDDRLTNKYIPGVQFIVGLASVPL